MNLLHANDRRGAYPASWYAETRDPLPPFPELRGDTRADVCVVGGGYTGLSAALHLARAGRDVVLLEAHRVGFGASGRNGGQVGSGQRLDVAELEKLAGREAARALWSMAEEARHLTIGLAAEAGVPFTPGIAHCARTPAEVAHARENAERMARDYGYDLIEPLDREGLRALVPSDAYIGGDIDRGAGHLHPLNLSLGVARLASEAGARLHELSEVHAIRHARAAGEKTLVLTGRGRVLCDHLILAGNGYLGHLDTRVAARVMPINNYIIATEPLGNLAETVLRADIAAHDTRFVVNYWRLTPDRRLLFGGGETVSYRFPKDMAAIVRRPMLEVYPQLAEVAITHAWGGTLAITMSRMPWFGRPAPNCLTAGGYSGHGVALALHAGRLMAEAIRGEAEGFDAMAVLPSRPFPGGAAFRWPLLVAGMSWYSLRDRLGW
ncbi:FAD-dependent oxidoreductase [Paracoccus sp. S-4012]|uniref:NAD(P)/FAD-dependent oxidoreductase n=1 Tax=Paracoccus sp. S-4012 TaxID=2665648 RepID=UPI0012AEEAB1|nr:FAD-binding oxidoreductase [Paracoccus sp. S-4012]MRX51476.1 FAD-dependent oxidoreductase [Paracoccus sp. S-4012]